MTIAILDPFSGISGDMMLGALLDVGLDPAWLRALPERLRLPDIGVRIQEVRRGEIVCQKVDFDIPPQPHGRHIREIRGLVESSGAPERVRRLANEAFTAIAEVEGAIHGMPADEVHLHEVGAVDAILDVVGSIWGLELLGVTRVHCGVLSVGDGFVTAAHGVLPVPAPATLRLLEGLRVRPGPEGAGELVTPTGAALVRVLSVGPPPDEYVPLRSGFGAGTKDPRGRANALRIVLAESHEADSTGEQELVMLAADIDDMSPEHLAAATDAVRDAGALDVVALTVAMKKGRLGTRVEALTTREASERVQQAMFSHTTTLGVRRHVVARRALDREMRSVSVLGHEVRVKVAALPDGGQRMKPELDDLRAVSRTTGRPIAEISALATSAAER